MNIITTAEIYGRNCHKVTNHLYDGYPYEIHLKSVYMEAQKFSHLVPEDERDNFLAAAWVHDCIEDCRQTYNDVAKATNKEIADIAYALSNEKGKSRKERANYKYYYEMKATPSAVLLKLCDRLANLKHSIASGSHMADRYKNEMKDFIDHLYDQRYEVVFAELKNLCK